MIVKAQSQQMLTTVIVLQCNERKKPLQGLMRKKINNKLVGSLINLINKHINSVKDAC